MTMKTTDAADPFAAAGNLRHICKFVEQAPAGIAMFDRAMRYLACSRRWLVDHGLEGQSVVGRLLYEIFPNIPERWKEFHERGMAGEAICTDEDPFVRADGRTVWLRWEMRPWLTCEGAVGGITINSEDITKSVEAVRALRESDEMLRFCLKGARAAAWQYDFVTHEQIWLPESYELHGRDPRLGKPSYDDWLHCLHPEDRPRIQRVVQEAVERKLPEYRAEYRVVCPWGEVRWLDAIAKVDYAGDGPPLRMSGINLDISERKRGEDAARKAGELERQEREELEAVLAALPAAVVIAKDADCSEMTGNRAAYELLRLPRT